MVINMNVNLNYTYKTVLRAVSVQDTMKVSIFVVWSPYSEWFTFSLAFPIAK